MCSSPGYVLFCLNRHHSLPQEPGPAKMAVTTTSSSIPSAEKVPTTKSTLWQEEMRAKDQPDGSSLSPAQSPSQSQPPATSTLREPGLEGKVGKPWPGWRKCSPLKCWNRPLSLQSWPWGHSGAAQLCCEPLLRVSHLRIHQPWAGPGLVGGLDPRAPAWIWPL